MFGIASEILVKYAEPHRFYHNHKHILDMIHVMIENEHNITVDLDDLMTAIVFHDYIYEIGSNSNEVLSALAYKNWARSNGVFKKDIYDAILGTEFPGQIFTDSSIELYLNDLDLYSLTSLDYFEHAYNIVKELSQAYSDKEIIDGRKIFLEDLLTKEIFYTNIVTSSEEERARANILTEINMLKSLQESPSEVSLLVYYSVNAF